MPRGSSEVERYILRCCYNMLDSCVLDYTHVCVCVHVGSYMCGIRTFLMKPQHEAATAFRVFTSDNAEEA